MREKLEACFDRLQTLNIEPTLDNMEKLVQTLYDLRDIYIEITKDGEENEQSEAEGRDDS